MATKLRTPKVKQMLFALVAVTVATCSTVKFEGNATAYTNVSLSNSLITQNSEPVVKWTTAQPLERLLKMTLQAAITPATQLIMKACLTSQDIDGQNIEVMKFPLKNEQMVECEYFGTGPSGWWVPGISAPTTITIPIDTTSLPSRARTLTLTVTDAANQEHKATLTLPAVDHNKILKASGIDTNILGWNNLRLPSNSRMGVISTIALYKKICIKAFNAELCEEPRLVNEDSKPINTNTACIPNGNHTVSMVGTTIRDETVTEAYSLSTLNPKPEFYKIKISNRKPTWTNKTVSSSLNILGENSCNYSVRLTGGAKTTTYNGVLSEDEDLLNLGVATISLTKLKPRTKYTAKVTISSPQGQRVVTKSFTTASIPSRPSGGGGSGGGNSGGGSGGISFVGWNLAEARSVVGYAYNARQASSCSQYGMENGLLGILNESNWTVVGQSGSTLYVCKR